MSKSLSHSGAGPGEVLSENAFSISIRRLVDFFSFANVDLIICTPHVHFQSVVHIQLFTVTNLNFVDQLFAGVFVLRRNCDFGFYRQTVHFFYSFRDSVIVHVEDHVERTYGLFDRRHQLQFVFVFDGYAKDGGDHDLDQKEDGARRHVCWLQCHGREWRDEISARAWRME